MDQQPQEILPAQSVARFAWVGHTFLLFVVGALLGFQGYNILENYFRFSYRQGLVGAILPLFMLVFISLASLIVSIIIMLGTRRIQHRKQIIQLGLMVALVALVTGTCFVYFRFSLADQLPQIRADVHNDAQYQKASKIGDCTSFTVSGYWTACLVNKVSTDSDFQTCASQATTHGFATKECSRARAITTQNGQYCTIFGTDELGSCAYDVINETYNKITVAKAADVCAQLQGRLSKSRCYVILLNGKPRDQLTPLKAQVCTGIDQSDLYPQEVSAYQSFCTI